MRPLLSPAQMGEADASTIESGTPGAVLMERAGRAVARTAITLLGGRYGRRVAVLCGKGNNGGDGFVAARVLHREGCAVRCFVLAAPDEFKGDAATHLVRMRKSGVRPAPFEVEAIGNPDLVIDAIFGTGFRGVVEGLPAQAIETINSTTAMVLAVDIPSGVEGATGAVKGLAVCADSTIAMAAQKLGTALSPGASHAGDVTVADIGIPVTEASVFEPVIDDVAAVLPQRKPESHKLSNGSVMLLAGSDGMSGAALLSARAAGRMGAGYVTLCSTPYVDRAKRTMLPEVVSMVDDEHAELGPDALEVFKSGLDRADAVGVGPGLGRGPRQSDLLQRALREIELPLVVDADALNALAGHTEWLTDREGPAVITPHPGEMARLLDTSASEVQARRLEAALSAASRFGCVAVLKGAGTVVADPSGRAIVNPTGGPELATAGTGDVLTGVLTGLLAERLEPFETAWAGVFVHGLAGEVAGRRHGGRGVIAWDVAEALPEALNEILVG
jgi:hydroxyethylthiazole kinase-like uncharacterized protein yjeF